MLSGTRGDSLLVHPDPRNSAKGGVVEKMALGISKDIFTNLLPISILCMKLE